MKLYVAVSLSAAERETLGRLTGAAEVWAADPANPTEADRRAFLEAEVVFGSFLVDLLPQAKRLRWIQLTGVGIDRYRAIDWARAAPQVLCTNAGDIYADAMAQTVLGGILALYREIDHLVRLQTARDWQKPLLHPRLRILAGAEVLLLGAGAVNRRLHELLQPFHCRFIRFGRTSGDIHTRADLDQAIPRADLVCAALPDTPETRGLIGREQLARFKPGAILTNVGRGSLVDEAALIDALQSRRLAGAVLDVTQREPLPPEDPLWRCPRLILTQHTSAGSTGVALAPVVLFGENLARYRAGEPLRHLIDWKKGY